MRLSVRPLPRRSGPRFLRTSGLIRVRLWLAMLGLAVLPMLGVVLIIAVLAPKEPPASADRRAWETSTAAAALTAAERALEGRVLGVAAGEEVRRLVDGIGGSTERGLASAIVSAIEDGRRGLVESACLTRSLDGAQVQFGYPSQAPSSASACGSASLLQRVL